MTPLRTMVDARGRRFTVCARDGFVDLAAQNVPGGTYVLDLVLTKDDAAALVRLLLATIVRDLAPAQPARKGGRHAA